MEAKWPCTLYAVDVILVLDVYNKLVGRHSFDFDNDNVFITDNRHSFITDNYLSS